MTTQQPGDLSETTGQKQQAVCPTTGQWQHRTMSSLAESPPTTCSQLNSRCETPNSSVESFSNVVVDQETQAFKEFYQEPFMWGLNGMMDCNLPLMPMQSCSQLNYENPMDMYQMTALHTQQQQQQMLSPVVVDPADVTALKQQEKRRKNNEASKRSRMLRKNKDNLIKEKSMKLEIENKRLITEIFTLRNEIKRLKNTSQSSSSTDGSSTSKESSSMSEQARQGLQFLEKLK